MATKKPAKVTEDAAAITAAEPKAEPKPKFDPNDTSIDARMWRLEQDHKRMGSR